MREGMRPEGRSVERPTIEEVRAWARDGGYRRVPVTRELLSDRITAIEALRAVRAVSNHCFLLESAEPDQRRGRYSFIGFKPTMEVTCVDGVLSVRSGLEGAGEPERTRVEHPGAFLRELIARHRSPRIEGLPPFTGGLMGYFAFDYLKYAEPSLSRGDLECGDFLDMDLMLFDRVIAFDSYRQRMVLIASVDLGTGDVDAAWERALGQLDEMEGVLAGTQRHAFKPLRLLEELSCRYDALRFAEMVSAAKERIREGDVFQVVLSNPQRARAEGSLFDAYRIMRSANPSPYMVFLSSDDVEIAAASPETLVRLEDGRLFTYPLAGTRPRGATPEEDAALERELLADDKELAEHNMLVDLGRNDLGRVSELGSVEVSSYHDILRFSHVMHIGSTVTGTLASDRDAVDVIDSILPAGTLSGAPKIRACQIIQDLEGARRGIYGGAIGYIDFTGNLDTCIAIRLAYKRGGEVCVQSGAGIVADSDPAREFAECRNKARAVVEALSVAEGGIA